MDGQLQGSATLSGSIIYDGTQFLRLGRWASGGRYFNGLMDEVDVYNRALAPAEIQAMHDAGKLGKCHEAPAILVQPAPTISRLTRATTAWMHASSRDGWRR